MQRSDVGLLVILLVCVALVITTPYAARTDNTALLVACMAVAVVNSAAATALVVRSTINYRRKYR